MLTFHNDPFVKDKYLSRVHAHRSADNLIQGTGWEDGKGCAVGCTLENYQHSRYPIELGLPEWLALLEDHIFEALPEKDAMNWPEQFLSAIPIGVEDRQMNILRDRFQIFWLTRQKSQIDCAKFPEVEVAINNTISLLQSAIDGKEPESAAWSAAWSAAESAAESAARSAARSAAWSAAESEAIVKRDWLLENLSKLAK